MKWLDIINAGEVVQGDRKGNLRRRRRGKYTIGCEGCPLNGAGAAKLLLRDELRRKVLLWFLHPIKEEAAQRKPLLSRSSQFLMEKFEQSGVPREDIAVQYVVRCLPITRSAGISYTREPNKEELAHCSGHSEEAIRLNRNEAGVHVFLGRDAAEAVLEKKEYRKDRPVFWSKSLAAKVFVLDPPKQIIDTQSKWRRREWEQRLKAATWQAQNPGQFSWLHHLDIEAVYDSEGLEEVIEQIEASGERVAVDIEDAKIKATGEHLVLCLSLSWGKNFARVVVLDHPENKTPRSKKKKLWATLKQLLEDPAIEKIFHYGSYDTFRLLELSGIDVQGYTFDTTYSHYLNYSFLRSHGLETIATLRYPHYAGYWDIVAPYWESENGLADCPLEDLILYNGADAAITKRCEMDTRDHISLPLLQIYIGAGRTLWQMERRGPILDRTHFETTKQIVYKKVEELTRELREMADDPDLNPAATKDIAYVIYDKLKLPPVESEDGREDENPYRTNEATLSIIAQETNHPFPALVLQYRRFAKMKSTYLLGYANSADMHGGEMRTKWFLTGAVTGRLRSGGAGDGHQGVVNFQNLHGSPQLKNLLVSDSDWRILYEECPQAIIEAITAASSEGKPLPEWKDLPEEVLDLDVFLSFDYSQIEIRMLAECSGDPLLIEQFQKGLDIHCAVGNAINPEWSLEFIKKDKDTRTFIKNCHFGLVYGLSETGLYYYLRAKGVNTTPEKAAKFHKDYFARYKGVAAFIRKMQAQAMERGFVDTLFGFRRRIGKEFNENRDTNPENQAVNSPIQGAAHTLLLAVMCLLDREPESFPDLLKPLMEVHDALVWKVKLRNLLQAYKQGKNLLEVRVKTFLQELYGFQIKVPLLSEGAVGFRYGVLLDYEGQALSAALPKWMAENLAVDGKMAKEFRLN